MSKMPCHPKQVETETYSFCFSKLSKARLDEDYPKKHPISATHTSMCSTAHFLLYISSAVS